MMPENTGKVEFVLALNGLKLVELTQFMHTKKIEIEAFMVCFMVSQQFYDCSIAAFNMFNLNRQVSKLVKIKKEFCTFAFRNKKFIKQNERYTTKVEIQGEGY
jgi:hypothetical protein